MRTTDQSYNTENLATGAEKEGLRIFDESIIETAKENFIKDGHLAPVVFVGFKNDEGFKVAVLPADAFMKNSQTKDQLGKLLRMVGKETDPVFIAMVMECWASKCKGKSKEQIIEQYQTMPPSKDPDRIEILLFTYESENIQRQRSFVIHREPVLSIESYKEMDEASSMEGRFSGMLRDLKKSKLN